MGSITLGYRLDNDGKSHEKIIIDDGRHGLIAGATGSGKTSRILLSNLLGDGLSGQSAVVFDPEGEAFLTSAEWLAKGLGHRIAIIDPFGRAAELAARNPKAYEYVIRNGLVESVGFNPMNTALDSGSEDFYDNAAALAEDRIELHDRDPHFGPSAQGLDSGLIMFVKEILREHASLTEVRRHLTDPDLFDDAGQPISGLAYTADQAIKRNERLNGGDAPSHGGNSYDIIASLLGKYRTPTRETQSVVSTVEVQTRWILSRKIQADMAKPGFRFQSLKEKPTILFVICPAKRLRQYRRWTRLLIGCALRSLYEPGGLRTTFFIDEMPSALGHLPALVDAYAISRKFNCQIISVVQDLNQLRHHFDALADSLLSNSHFLQFHGSNDLMTSEWVSKRSGTIIDRLESFSKSRPLYGDVFTGSKNESSADSYRPSLRPEEIIGMSAGTGILFLSNLKQYVRFKAPFYDEDKKLTQRAAPNPFRTR